jgi:hypothetical protein
MLGRGQLGGLLRGLLAGITSSAAALNLTVRSTSIALGFSKNNSHMTIECMLIYGIPCMHEHNNCYWCMHRVSRFGM